MAWRGGFFFVEHLSAHHEPGKRTPGMHSIFYIIGVVVVLVVVLKLLGLY